MFLNLNLFYADLNKITLQFFDCCDKDIFAFLSFCKVRALISGFVTISTFIYEIYQFSPGHWNSWNTPDWVATLQYIHMLLICDEMSLYCLLSTNGKVRTSKSSLKPNLKIITFYDSKPYTQKLNSSTLLQLQHNTNDEIIFNQIKIEK